MEIQETIEITTINVSLRIDPQNEDLPEIGTFMQAFNAECNHLGIDFTFDSSERQADPTGPYQALTIAIHEPLEATEQRWQDLKAWLVSYPRPPLIVFFSDDEPLGY